jgi:hypothetical protein
MLLAVELGRLGGPGFAVRDENRLAKITVQWTAGFAGVEGEASFCWD